MITVYLNGKEIGRYDTASDVWIDYPDAEVRNQKAFIKEED